MEKPEPDSEATAMNTWEPATAEELGEYVLEGLLDCSSHQRELFSRISIHPEKWQLSPWGDRGGGFWAVAIANGKVLFYDDVEGGFVCSSFRQHGVIPEDQYSCSQHSFSRVHNGASISGGNPRG